MPRTLASIVLALFVAAPSISVSSLNVFAQTTGGGSGTQQSGEPASMTGSATDPQSLGSGRTYGEVNRPNSPGYATDDRGGFDFGWLGLIGAAGLLGGRHARRSADVAR